MKFFEQISGGLVSVFCFVFFLRMLAIYYFFRNLIFKILEVLKETIFFGSSKKYLIKSVIVIEGKENFKSHQSSKHQNYILLTNS